MRSIKEKKERALGTKLFLKAERCNSPKCVMIRRPYRPGVHGQKRRRAPSEYGKQLQEKQKIQIIYGLTNKQMKTLFKQPREKLLLILEQRLDRVVFLLGLAPSSRVARQLVSHGHIIVNNRKVTISSYHVKVGDVIAIRPESRSKKIFEDIELRLKKYEPPTWLKLDKKELRGECIENPKAEDINLPFNINLVGQFYSR
ncbi:MAG: 30S ribosomal protein S4 [Patescibacteria group bacterium]|nr:30S ribosomal protein S4 [Patescibacteria group bacterium]